MNLAIEIFLGISAVGAGLFVLILFVALAIALSLAFFAPKEPRTR